MNKMSNISRIYGQTQGFLSSIDTNDLIPKISLLEYRLKNIKPFKTPNFFRKFSKFVRQAASALFSQEVLLLKHDKEELVKLKSPQKKLDTIKLKLGHMKRYLRSKNPDYYAKNCKTDILKIYWQSKYEVKIAENIVSYLDLYEQEINRLEN